MVKAKVAWFKAHRDILISDIVHVKRPTGQGIDAFLHVNPKLSSHKAMAMVFNPTTEALSDNVTLPLYYSGLTDGVMVSVGGAAPTKASLERDYSLSVPVTLAAKSTTWILLTDPAAPATLKLDDEKAKRTMTYWAGASNMTLNGKPSCMLEFHPQGCPNWTIGSAHWEERLANIQKHRANVTGIIPAMHAVVNGGKLGLNGDGSYHNFLPYLPRLKAMGLEILAFLGNAGKPQQPALEAAIKRSDDFIQECIDMVRSDELLFSIARLPSRLAHLARDPFRRTRTATTGTRGTMSSIASRT